MKKIRQLIVLVQISTSLIYSQSTTNSNLGTVPTEYLGWNSNSSEHLRIQTGGAYKLNFFTDSVLHMIVTEGDGTTFGDGQIAMGRLLTLGWNPDEVLHLVDEDDERTYMGFSQFDDEDSHLRVGLSANYTGGHADFWMRTYKDVRIWQSDSIRIRINKDADYIEKSESTTQIEAGRMVLQATEVNDVTEPLSLLHLQGDEAVTSNLNRDWAHVGTSFTDNGDYMYVGLQQQPSTTGVDQNDAVIAWGKDESGPNGPDNLKFVFLNTEVASSSDPGEQKDGLEVGRFTPDGNFGIGNFYTNGLDEQPSHRLDVDGDVRIRDVGPLTTPSTSSDVLLVGDYQGAAGDYKVQRVAFSGDAGEVLNGVGEWKDICNWEQVSNNWHIAAPSSDCIEEDQTLSMGIDGQSLAKLYVKNIRSNTSVRSGIKVVHDAGTSSTGLNGAIEASSFGNGTNNYGLYVSGEAENNNHSGFFQAKAVSGTTTNRGLEIKVTDANGVGGVTESQGINCVAKHGEEVIGIRVETTHESSVTDKNY